ncbi:MAG: thioredoxin family protein [Candidatus Aenigmatarchaeota archaeon]
MEIEVIGSGCLKCKKLYEITKQAAKELGINDEVKYITRDKGLKKLIELGAMSSPVIAINEKIVFVGFTNDIEKIKKALRR